MKAVVIDPNDWRDRIWPSLLEQHGNAIGIREVCKRRLGFTVREHREYVDDLESYPYMDDDWIQQFGKPKRCEVTIRLDFDDEQRKLMFMMKWIG